MSPPSATGSLQLFARRGNPTTNVWQKAAQEMAQEKPAVRSVATKFKILLTFFPTSTKTPVKKFGEEDKHNALASKLSRAKPPNSGLSNSSGLSVSNYVKGSHPDTNLEEQTHIPGTFSPPKANKNNWVLQRTMSKIEC